jgi:hypothetical protein
MYLIRRLPVQALVPAFTIVKPEIISDTQPGLGNRVVRFQIHLFVFQAAPQTFHKHIVHTITLAVHADLDACRLDNAGESVTGKLCTLISVENIRWTRHAMSWKVLGIHRERAPVG